MNKKQHCDHLDLHLWKVQNWYDYFIKYYNTDPENSKKKLQKLLLDLLKNVVVTRFWDQNGSKLQYHFE